MQHYYITLFHSSIQSLLYHMSGDNVNTKSNNIFLAMRPMHRLLVSLGSALIVFLLTINSNLNSLVLAMLCWDTFAFVFVATSWTFLFKCPTSKIREEATREDGSRIFIFFMVMISSFASLFTVTLLILSKEASSTGLIIYLPVAVLGMLLSWVLVHTTFTFKYAHMYYDDDENDAGKHAEGLEFPKEKKPDYLDFAYFAFVIGMTFQVSDVEISSRSIRRVALIHGLLSFALNTFVVALTINLIAGLKD